MTDPDPLMVELFKKVPSPGSVWPLDQRALWLSACDAIFNVIYGPVERIDIPALFISTGVSADAIERLRSKPGSFTAVAKADTLEPAPEIKVGDTVTAPGTPLDGHVITKILSEPAVLSSPEPTSRGAGGARGANRKSLDRPDGCPSNLEMAIATLLELGPSSGNAIREHVRRTWWPDAPGGWSGCLYSYAESGKLARDGINFVLPSQLKLPDSIRDLIDPQVRDAIERPLRDPKVVIVPKATTAPPAHQPPPPAAIIKPAAPPANHAEFEWRGKKASLPVPHYRALQRLKPVVDQGFLEFAVISGAAFAGQSHPSDPRAWCRDAEPVINAAIAPLGLFFKLVPKLGYALQETN